MASGGDWEGQRVAQKSPGAGGTSREQGEGGRIRKKGKKQRLRCLDGSLGLDLMGGGGTLRGNGPRIKIQSPGSPPGSATNLPCVPSPVPNTNVCKVPSGPLMLPTQDSALAGPSKEKREEASTTSAPGATSKAPFRYRELSLLQKISWMALQGAGERHPVMATRLTRRSTLKVDSESKGDDGQHLLNLYCLPGVPKCLAYILPQTLWGRYYYPHVQMEN